LPELPEWFEEERREAETLKLRLLRRLAELEAPEPGRAAETLEALLRLDPYDVEARERLIAHYQALGEDELARREREQLALLERELS
jgi:DNA-binding SARP family transcriptional activator